MVETRVGLTGTLAGNWLLPFGAWALWFPSRFSQTSVAWSACGSLSRVVHGGGSGSCWLPLSLDCFPFCLSLLLLPVFISLDLKMLLLGIPGK